MKSVESIYIENHVVQCGKYNKLLFCIQTMNIDKIEIEIEKDDEEEEELQYICILKEHLENRACLEVPLISKTMNFRRK